MASVSEDLIGDRASFVHLRVRSEYSMSAGLAKVEHLAQCAAEIGMPALALTDRASLSGYIKFYSACVESGIKPVAGVDMPFRGEHEDAEISHCLLLATNPAGYNNLLRVIFQLRKDRQSGLRVSTRQCIFAHAEGLIALSGGSQGDVGKALLRADEALARAHLDAWMGAFPDSFYLELMRCDRKADERIESQVIDLAARYSAPLVATNEVMYARPEDYEFHEIRVCVQEKQVIDDPARERQYTEAMWLKSAADMVALFADIPEAVHNSVELAKRCNLPQSFYQHAFPKYPEAEGGEFDSLEAYLTRLAEDKLEERLQAMQTPDAPSPELRERYIARLASELDVICSMKYAGYFLVVMSIIGWAKSERIPVGPGRGSGAGSLVAWVLGITGLDPIEHGLLFERFLNKERVSLPDFDIDICMEQRDRVLQHIADRYGRDAVGQIVTFGTMGAKAVVRDVARAQGKPYKMGDTLARLIPNQLDIRLADAVEGQPELRRLIKQEPEYAEIMDAAYRLEGCVRNEGTHAAGVVIAPSRLSDFLPATVSDQGDAVTQFDWKDVEKAGLIKFDFLGLRTLTVIEHAVRSLNRNHHLNLDIEDIPLDDDKTFRLLQLAQTRGIFQLESDGLRRLILRLKPQSLADLTALLALYRPGPLQSGMVDSFIEVREGKSTPEYLHPAMRDVIESTSGIILFQEQVMQLAQVMAGFTLGQADVLRAAMGKKKPEIMAEQRSRFVQGARTRNISGVVAEKVFDLMDKFAGYGFNRSHSTAYALISYQTAWLKANYPAEFMAALLSSEMQNRDAIHKLMPELAQLGLDTLPPDVNESHLEFRAQGRAVRYGLGGIRDVGWPLIEQIVKQRASRRYESLSDFVSRVGTRFLTTAPLQRLIESGALDELADGHVNEKRAHMLHMVKDVLNWVAQRERDRSAGVADMFDEDAELPSLGVPNCRPMTDLARLACEDQALGLYLTDHPMNVYRRECEWLYLGRRGAAADNGTRRRYSTTAFAGIITRLNHRGREGGETWARLENGHEHAEAGFFESVLEAQREKLREGAYLLIEGAAPRGDDRSGFGARIRVSCAYTLAEAREKFARSIELHVDDTTGSARLRETLGALGSKGRKSNCRVLVRYSCEHARACLRLPKDFSILPSDENLGQLREILGGDAVKLNYRA